jgi:hypothetical protein
MTERDPTYLMIAEKLPSGKRTADEIKEEETRLAAKFRQRAECDFRLVWMPLI